MPALKLIRLTKSFGANNAGEIASFTPDTAAHILKHQGGEVLGDFDPTRQVVVKREVDGEEKILIVDAERDANGNMVEKKSAPAAKKPEGDNKPKQ
jgi:hypothetical protein